MQDPDTMQGGQDTANPVNPEIRADNFNPTATEPVSLAEPDRDTPLPEHLERENREIEQLVDEGPHTDADVRPDPDPEPLLQPRIPPTIRDDLPPAQTPVAPVARRRGGFVPLVLGGALAAGAGFALATYVPDGWPQGGTADLETRLGSALAEIETLKASVASLPAPDAGLQDRIAALESVEPLPAPVVDLGPIEGRVIALEEQVSALSALPQDGSGVPQAAIVGLQNQIAALEERIASQTTDAAGVPAEIEALAETAVARLAEVEAQAVALREATDGALRDAALRTSLGRIQAALETGAPFATAVEEFRAAGVEVPPALADAGAEGIPTLASLQVSFPDAARAALAASTRATMGEGFTDRVGAFLRTQGGVRSLTPREGSDPDAILSRAEAALRAGQLGEALTELAALPPEGQTVLADWTALAARRLAAADGLVALTATLDAS